MSDKGTAVAKAAAADTTAVAVADDAAKTSGDDKIVVAAEDDAEGDDESASSEDAATETEASEGEGEAEGDALSKGQKKREAKKRRVEALKAENDRLKSRLDAVERNKPAVEELGPEPDPAKYDSDAKYAAALAVWEVRKEFGQRQTKAHETDANTARADAAAASMTLFRERATALTDRYPDIEEKVFGDKTGLFDARLAEMLVDSEMGPEVAYYLSGNRSEAQRIKSMPQIAAAREIGRLEAKLSLPKTRTETKAPPPPPTVSGSVRGPAKKLEDMSMAEYRRARGFD